MLKPIRLLLSLLLFGAYTALPAQTNFLPDTTELSRCFDNKDKKLFAKPSKVYYPEIWVNCLGGNLSKKGILADLEAIAEGGFKGVQFFFGNRGGIWPGVDSPILCLSQEWDDFVRYAAQEAKRLGLRFTLQNCTGWAMAGGPWIKPEHSMRHLVWTETDITGGEMTDIELPASPYQQTEWRNYQDLMVLAFPSPLGENRHLLPKQTTSNIVHIPWYECLMAGRHPFTLPATTKDRPHWVDITLHEAETVRSIEFSSINGFSHWFCYEPGVSVMVEAIYEDCDTVVILNTDMPASNWQDNMPITLTCNECVPTRNYRVSIVNAHGMGISSLRLRNIAKKNNWEAEAGWTLRNNMYNNEHPGHPAEAYINSSDILDLTSLTDKNSRLRWKAPQGKWKVLRIGHVNTGMKNAPAPPEATGWECNKFGVLGAEKHFQGYVGRLHEGPLQGLLDGMLLDSWECETQTWTQNMEQEFLDMSGYELKRWIPALMGYIINNPETTSRFLRDWKRTINELVANRFYRRMAELAKENGLAITYETAAGDVFPADIMEYFKYADIPMCEFWQHQPEIFVGSLNFKPIKPTVSAARLYGKPRIGAEAFTSLQLTWNEKLRMLKETANKNQIEGATHFAFQAYTHNPLPDVLVPGSSFGSDIGTPFMRSQTWWKYMPDFTTYIARTTYMLERGKPVSDFLWYLGDESDHKPDQLAAFPEGFKYDYCNPDILLNRLDVANGRLITPEGISYTAIWLPDTYRMLPETLEKLVELTQKGATIIGNAPRYPATLSSPEETEKRFDKAVGILWGNTDSPAIRNVGKGKVICHMTIDEAIENLSLQPDVIGGEIQWLHRRTEGADWYYICPPMGKTFQGTVDFREGGSAELWNPVTGETTPIQTESRDGRTHIDLTLAKGESYFVVFHKGQKQGHILNKRSTEQIIIPDFNWTVSFPEGWNVGPSSIQTDILKAWKDMELTDEGKAFSGTAKYSTTFKLDKKQCKTKYIIDLGRVESIARVKLNGKHISTLWTYPYRTNVSEFIQEGKNRLEIEVTDTWFNRLVYDAGQPEEKRKTWTINAPHMSSPLKESGLLGPVCIKILQ